MAIHYNVKSVTDGLVLALDAANPKSYPGSGTTWSDLSGKGNTGTLVNGVGYNSSNNGSLVFNGSNQYGTIPLSSNFEFGTGQFAVEAWVNLASATIANSRIIGIGDGANGGTPVTYTGWTFGVRNNGGIITLMFYRYSGAELLIEVVIPSFSTNQWFHFVATRDASNTLTLYSNSVAISTTASVTQSYNSVNSQPLYLGYANWATAPLYLNGRIPVARIYKGKGLTASEVSQNYNALKSRYV